MPMQDKTANRSDWKTLPLGSTVPLNYRTSFTPDEYAVLRRGLVPLEMEDKWFVFCEADSLFFHRSWTGMGVYRVDFRPTGDGFEVSNAFVTTDHDQYRRGTDGYEAALLDFLIRALLLGQSIEFPLPLGVGSARGLYQHQIAGTGFPERTIGRNQATFVSRFKQWIGL